MHIKVSGYEKELYIADVIVNNLERTKKAVSQDDWDYLAIVCGLPGVGKSTFAQGLAKYLDPNFDVDNICFTAQEFIEKTDKANKGQAFILDESFADMNTSLSQDPEFIALLNHIQTVRYKNLYLLIVLPDFFTLHRNIAVFRASHLFVPYSEDYSRGDVAVFGKDTKRLLYFKGKKECNYQAVEPNFRTDYDKDWFVDKKEYDQRKKIHTDNQRKIRELGNKYTKIVQQLAYLLYSEAGMTEQAISDALGRARTTVEGWITAGRLWYASKFDGKTEIK